MSYFDLKLHDMFEKKEDVIKVEFLPKHLWRVLKGLCVLTDVDSLNNFTKQK